MARHTAPTVSHTALWTAPAPLAGRFGDSAADLGRFNAESSRPALLRFDTDEFMDQVLATLAADPQQLGAFVARPETWRTPMLGEGEAPDLVERTPLPRLARRFKRLTTAQAARSVIPPSAPERDLQEQGVTRTLPLKLYQPAQQRHYLVAAQLVCGLPGLPDRALASGGREQVGYVLRRLLPRSAGSSERVEFGFVKSAGGPGGARWQRVVPEGGSADAATQLAEGEELLPLFPLNFADDAGRPRRLLSGSIPVGRREEYMATRAQHEAATSGAEPGVAANPSRVAARKEQFKLEVTEPWKNLVRTAMQAQARIENTVPEAGSASNRFSAAAAMNAQLQGGSWLTLLDFADYLAVHLPEVWKAISGEIAAAALPTTAQQSLFAWLDSPGTAMAPNQPGLPATPAASLRDALRRVRTATVRQGLERATVAYPDANDDPAGWPAFGYLLAGLNRKADGHFEAVGPHGALAPQPAGDNDDADPLAPPLPVPPTPTPLQLIEQQAALLDKLVQLVVVALGSTPPSAATPPLPFAVKLRDALRTTQGDEGWFTIRCVYQRCDCGPLHPPTLSAPSERFQLASFFDPDAPARPVRISLPMDTTPAGLRKHQKNAALVVSDVLCGQIQRAKGLGLVDLVLSVLPWPLHKDLNLAGTGKCKNPASLDIGMICSLSIPIVTLCALILLMIIVSLLDFIFRWMPWFVMCLPVPGLKGKK